MSKDDLMYELAHLLHTPLTGLSSGADLLGRLVPDLRAKQADPLKELVKRNAGLLALRIRELLARFVEEGDTIVLRLTAEDIAAIKISAAGASSEATGRGAAAPQLGDTGPLVLVADDETDLRLLIATALRDHGFPTLEARNGEEALTLIEDRRPDLLILDGLMPKMSGLEVAKQVKAIDPAYQPKIILMTAVYKRTSYKYEARALGVDEYLTKPFEIDDLLHHIARLVETKTASQT